MRRDRVVRLALGVCVCHENGLVCAAPSKRLQLCLYRCSGIVVRVGRRVERLREVGAEYGDRCLYSAVRSHTECVKEKERKEKKEKKKRSIYHDNTRQMQVVFLRREWQVLWHSPPVQWAYSTPSQHNLQQSKPPYHVLFLVLLFAFHLEHSCSIRSRRREASVGRFDQLPPIRIVVDSIPIPVRISAAFVVSDSSPTSWRRV